MTSKEEYILHCKQDDKAPLFHQPFWWDAVVDEWNVEKLKTENAIAYLPYASYKKWGFSFSRNPYLTPYSGLLFADSNYTPEIKQALFTQAQRFLQQFDISQYDLLPKHAGAIQSDKKKTTYLLHTGKTFDEIKANFKSSLKRQLKKAESNLSIKEDDSFKNLYSIYLNSLSRQKSAEIVPKKTVEQVWTLCKTKGLGKIFIAQDEHSNTHAAIWYVKDSNCGYYLLGGSATEYLGSGAMGFLLEHCIKQAIQEDKQYFDFEGSEVPGVARFFAGFGGTKIDYPILSAKTNPKLKALLKLKGLLMK